MHPWPGEHSLCAICGHAPVVVLKRLSDLLPHHAVVLLLLQHLQGLHGVLVGVGRPLVHVSGVTSPDHLLDGHFGRRHSWHSIRRGFKPGTCCVRKSKENIIHQNHSNFQVSSIYRNTFISNKMYILYMYKYMYITV